MKSIKILIISILYCLTASGDYWEISNKAIFDISTMGMINEDVAKSVILNYSNFTKECDLKEEIFLKTFNVCINEKIRILESKKINNMDFIKYCIKFGIGSAVTSASIFYYTYKKLKENYGRFDFTEVNTALACLCVVLSINEAVEIIRTKNDLKYYDSELEKFKLVSETIKQLL